MKKFISLLVIFYPLQLFAQVIAWGTGSSNSHNDSLGRFAIPFNSNNSWETISVFDNNGSPGNAFWNRITTGYTQGAYLGTQPVFGSPTVYDGAAAFDSDYLDNNGVPAAQGTGTAPAPHEGQLYSPIFDLSNYQNHRVSIEFYLFYKNFTINVLSLGYSNDGGVNWHEISILQGVGMNQKFYTDLLHYELPFFSYQNNLSNCQLRFTFSGNYYNAIIDDLTIFACSPSIKNIVTTACGSYNFEGNNITTSGFYSDTISYSDYCDSIKTLDLNLVNLNNSVTVSGDTLFSNEILGSYQWLDCNNFYTSVSGASNQFYIPLNENYYAVQNTFSNCIDTSSCFSVLSNNKINISESEIYPNPCDESFTIDWEIHDANIQIFTNTGKLILSQEIYTGKNNIPTSELADGIYLLKIIESEFNLNRLLIIMH